MDDALRSLFALDKNDANYSIQIVVWDNTDNETWDAEYVIQSEDMANERIAKHVTKGLTKFMDTYKKTPLIGRVAKEKKKKVTPDPK